MNDHDKLLWLFNQTQGEIQGECFPKVYEDDNGAPVGVHLMKNGQPAWSKNKVDLIFDYITRNKR